MIIAQEIKKKSVIHFLLGTIFFLLIFKITPNSYIGDQWGNVVTEVMVLIIILSFLIFSKKMFFPKNEIILLMSAIIFLSTIFSFRILFGFSSDIKEIFNLFLYLIIYIFFKNAFKLYDLNKDSLLRSFYIIIFINIILSISAYHFSFIFEIYNIIFQTTKSAVIGSDYQRFSGTFSNPNFFGIFYAITSTYLLFIFFSRNQKKIHVLITAMLSIYLVNISGSRSGMLTLIILCTVLFGIFILEFLKNKKNKSNTLLRGILLCVIIIPILTSSIYVIANSNIDFANSEIGFLNSRITDLNSSEANLMGRIQMAKIALEEFTQNPFIGVGPIEGSTDNQYAKILMESGMIIFILFIILFSYFLISNYKNYREFKTKTIKERYMLTLLITIAFLINMYGAALFSVTQLTSIYFIMLAFNEK